jgi:hypothetical protein
MSNGCNYKVYVLNDIDTNHTQHTVKQTIELVVASFTTNIMLIINY